jgi:hypothetical protein
MIASVPASAPPGPPLTGASSTSIPAGSSSEASLRESDGGLVDMSTRSPPRLSPCAIPSGPSAASSTASGDGSERIATSALEAASAGVDAAGTPSAAARAGSRSQATSSCAAAMRWLAMRAPMVPRPMNATRVMRAELTEAVPEGR